MASENRNLKRVAAAIVTRIGSKRGNGYYVIIITSQEFFKIGMA